MSNLVMGLPLPLLLVFGLYHLMAWFNLLRINNRVYWKRVALVSAIAHALLAAGFFVFTYFDFRADRDLAGFGLGYGPFLFDRSQFWPLMTIFDTLPMALLLGLFMFLNWIGFSLPGLLPLTILITFAAGTVEWYFVGGGMGELLSRIWNALRTEDDEFSD